MPSPERVWWCAMGNHVTAAELRPEMCPKCGAKVYDYGWRVGFNEATYSYYSTHEGALKDKRV